MYFISQVGEHDCAFTCLTMMLANYHKDKNYLFIKHEDRSYSFKELITIGECYGLTLSGVKVENPDELAKCEKFPIIVVIENEQGANHSVLLLSFNNKKVTYFDPAIGKKSEPHDEFVEKFKNVALIVAKVHKMKRVDTPKDYISLRDKITLPIFQILSGASLLLGTYFIDKDSYVFVPVLLLALFGVFELLFRDNLIGAMRRMETNMQGYSIEVKDNNYYHFYEASEKYRQTALSNIPNFIYSAMITIFIIFIFLINSLENFMLIIFPIVFSFVEILFLQPMLKNNETEITSLEKRITTIKDEEEYLAVSSKARNYAYLSGIVSSVATYLFIAIQLTVIILMMRRASTINITFLVFNLCLSTMLRKNIKNLLMFSEISQVADDMRIKIICSLSEE